MRFKAGGRESFKKWLNQTLPKIPHITRHAMRSFAYKPSFGSSQGRKFVDFIWSEFYKYFDSLRRPGECPFCYMQRKEISRQIKKALAHGAEQILGNPMKYETVHVLLTCTGNIKGDASPRDIVNTNMWHIRNNREPPGHILCANCQRHKPGAHTLKEIYVDLYLNWCLKEAKCAILKSKNRTKIVKYLLENDEWINFQTLTRLLRLSEKRILGEIVNPGKQAPKLVEMRVVLFDEKRNKIRLNPRFKEELKALMSGKASGTSESKTPDTLEKYLE